MALAAAAEWIGFSKEVGAFLGGVSLASTPYREAIGARLVSLRDFLLLFFFIDLGAGLDLGHLLGQAGMAVALSLSVLRRQALRLPRDPRGSRVSEAHELSHSEFPSRRSASSH